MSHAWTPMVGIAAIWRSTCEPCLDTDGLEPYWPEKHGFDVNLGGCHFGHPPQGYFAPWGIPHAA